MTKTRYALLGAGHRSQMYVDAITGDHADRADLVAVCEPNPVRAAHAVDRAVSRGAAAPSVWGPDRLEEMIAAERIDRVIICARDNLHAELIVRSLDAGADVVVEKPLTIDAASAAAIEKAVARTGRTVVLTFNYRYSPRNSALRQVIQDGLIGEVTSIDFSWMLDTKHGADYFRRWHREKVNNGGLLVHKSSHHFDLVNWWIDAVPERVFASGGRRFYGDDGAHAQGYEPTAAVRELNERGVDPWFLDVDQDARLAALYGPEAQAVDGYVRNRSVFDAGITTEDTLGLVVEYAGGPVLTYSLVASAPWEGYRVVVNGSRGRAELEVVERGSVEFGDDGRAILDPSLTEAFAEDPVRPAGDRLVVQRHWERAEERPIVAVGPGGHGGGDRLLLADVFGTPADPDPLGRAARLVDGLRASGIGYAGNRSLETGEPVRLADLGLGTDLS